MRVGRLPELAWPGGPIVPTVEKARGEGKWRKIGLEETVLSPSNQDKNPTDMSIDYSPLTINDNISSDYSPLSINGNVGINESLSGAITTWS
nr:hypothetical protein Iba_chr12bCG15780 [Ipomoea batatas]